MKKIHRAIEGDKTAVEKLPRTSFWTTVKSFNSSANNKWIAQPRSTWLGYFPGRNSNHREMPWEGRIRKCQWANVLWMHCSSETNPWVDSFSGCSTCSKLHQKKPEPIIHRDVSSANVLLWRQGDQWRGKVSDYGTANFMQQTMTLAPGARIYSVPEALTSNQAMKVCFSHCSRLLTLA